MSIPPNVEKRFLGHPNAKKEKGQFGTGDSQLVTQASTNPAQRRLTSEF